MKKKTKKQVKPAPVVIYRDDEGMIGFEPKGSDAFVKAECDGFCVWFDKMDDVELDVVNLDKLISWLMQARVRMNHAHAGAKKRKAVRK